MTRECPPHTPQYQHDHGTVRCVRCGREWPVKGISTYKGTITYEYDWTAPDPSRWDITMLDNCLREIWEEPPRVGVRVCGIFWPIITTKGKDNV